MAAPVPAAGQAAFLNAAELECLTALVDTIIPRTDTPGALDAGVPAAIDRRLAAGPQVAERFRAEMKTFDADTRSRFGTPFPKLTAEQRIEWLKSRAEDPFFRTVKSLTVDAYYTSKEGLSEELGWHGNTFLTEFKGCTHPEHQR
jgi:hypothetical protein